MTAQQWQEARAKVVKASLNLAAVEWNNGRLTADGSADLDMAHDRLDEALGDYVEATKS